MFREDLYYRLNVIQIAVPPLRQRGEDVLLLLRYYLQRASEAHRLPIPELTQDAERVLMEYSWPGNIRELKNMTERLVVRAHDTAIVARRSAARDARGQPHHGRRRAAGGAGGSGAQPALSATWCAAPRPRRSCGSG